MRSAREAVNPEAADRATFGMPAKISRAASADTTQEPNLLMFHIRLLEFGQQYH
jgi:hypothetical protein